MAVKNYALTTRTKVKEFLSISGTANDTLLDSLINYATDYIESLCGGRRFLNSTYTDEKYDVPEGGTLLFLKQYPVNTLTAVQYRTGTISSPTWNDFNADYYLLFSREGYIKFYTKFSTLSQPEQMLNISYTAGYLIDFTNETDTSAHTLPSDLTMLANEIVGMLFNRRAAQGITSESTEGQSVTYEKGADVELNETQKAIIGKYQKLSVN